MVQTQLHTGALQPTVGEQVSVCGAAAWVIHAHGGQAMHLRKPNRPTLSQGLMPLRAPPVSTLTGVPAPQVHAAVGIPPPEMGCPETSCEFLKWV